MSRSTTPKKTRLPGAASSAALARASAVPAAPAQQLRFARLLPGDPAPWFRQRSSNNPAFTFHTAAGRAILLCLFGSARDEGVRTRLAAMAAVPFVNDDACAGFGVSVDPEDETLGRVTERMPGIRHFWDFDCSISRAYGSLSLGDADANPATSPYRGQWVVLDKQLRVVAAIPFAKDGSDARAALSVTAEHIKASRAAEDLPVPVMVLPRVFEPEFCQMLIDGYEKDGGEESGFMRDVDGQTRRLMDASHKRRRDWTIETQDIMRATQARVLRRIVPEIAKVHQFRITRMERYIVGCYTAEDGGHFRAHRDNTTKGTAHRRFAVSINLSDDFDGGLVHFPEFSSRGFKPPVGGALVFSCSLLHMVSPVTRGRRYVFLPFLYDDAAAKVREANNAYLGEEVGEYRG